MGGEKPSDRSRPHPPEGPPIRPTAPPWPSPRPPLRDDLPWPEPGEARPWRGQLHPTLPDEVVWLLGLSATSPLRAPGPFELSLQVDWEHTAQGPRGTLSLTALRKPDRAPLERFTHRFHPYDRNQLLPLAALCRQPFWHLLACADRAVLHAVELRNTLDLPTLLRPPGPRGPAL